MLVKVIIGLWILTLVLAFLTGVERGKLWGLNKAYEVCRKVAPKGENPCSDN